MRLKIHRRNRLGPLLGVVLICQGLAAAQQVPSDATARYTDPANGQGSEELVQQALKQNGDLLAARLQVEAASGRVAQARLRPNPSLNISSLKEVSGANNDITIGASLPLELFGRRGRRVEVAARERNLMKDEVADRERQLAAAVRSKYGEALAAIRNLQFVDELLGLNRSSLELTSARVQKGATPQLEEDLVRVEVNRIETLRTEFEARVEIILLELKNLAGMQVGDSLRLKGGFDPAPVQLAREEALSRALAQRSDLRAARTAEDVASAHLRQAQTDGLPDASFSVNYQRADSGFGVNGFDPAGNLRRVQGIFHFLTFGVSVSLPVRNRNQGAVESAAAEAAAARQRREFAELVAGREVATALVRLKKARRNLDLYTRGVREQAQKNLGVIRQTYVLGLTPLLDVIAEQRRYIDIETGYTEVLNQYYQAVVELERAVGNPVK